MSKSNIIDQILSLMKENGITNREILQNNINVNNENASKVTICCLVSDEAHNKYKQYMKNDTVNTITGNRWYYYNCNYIRNAQNGKVLSQGTIIDNCGHVQDDNINKPGFTQEYNVYNSNGGIGENYISGSDSYLKFTRIINQDSKNSSFNVNNQLSSIKAVFNRAGGSDIASFLINNQNKICEFDKQSFILDISQKWGSSSINYTLHFQQLATFVPCFKF